MSEIATTTEKPATLASFLESQKIQIQKALPRHLTADRMLRIVMTEIRKTPKLKQCTPQSLIGAVIQASQLGLEPGSSLGHCYLIPYENKKEGTVECQFMIGYRGMIDLARRSGQIESIQTQAIYDKDFFEFEYGLNEKLKHIPARGERGEIVGAYAIAKFMGGGHQMDVMWKSDIDKIKARSKTSNYGPWQTDYDEMGKKSVVRRMFKYLPVSIEVQRAVMLDEAADRGEQYNSLVIEGDVDTDTGEITNVQQDKGSEIMDKISPSKEEQLQTLKSQMNIN